VLDQATEIGWRKKVGVVYSKRRGLHDFVDEFASEVVAGKYEVKF